MAIKEKRLFFRPDWESVVTPVVDYALSRVDEAPGKLVIFGWSMGGYLVAKAGTKEHRAAALILGDGASHRLGGGRISPWILSYTVG